MKAIELGAEEERVKTLREYALLDTPPEGVFDGIVTLAAGVLEAPIALFSLVDGDRAWFKARVGTDAEEVSRDYSFCTYSATHDEVLIVEDARRDPRFAKNVLVQDSPYIRFYVGVPVHGENGYAIGTLCVIDTKPRSISDRERQLLECLARELEAQLVLRRVMSEQQKLFDERAILWDMILHDASGIVAVLRWYFKLLEDEVGKNSEVLSQCQSATDEFLRLCESVLKFNDNQPRAITAESAPSDLRPWLDFLGRRVKRIGREVDVAVELSNDLPNAPIETDVHLLERVIMNLVSNAVDACSPGSTIRISAHADQGSNLVFSVADDGPGVALELSERIFEPYFSRRQAGGQGTGLGLAICRISAKALGGSIEFKAREPHGAEFIVKVPAT